MDNILDTILKWAGSSGKSENPGQRLFPANKRPTLDNLGETKQGRKEEAQNLLKPLLDTILNIGSVGLSAGPSMAQFASSTTDSEAASFIPAKNLTGLRGDIAKQVQEQIEYSAKRGYPIFNRALYNHEKIPLFVSPSSGQLMTINPAIDKLASMNKAVAEPTLAKDILDPEILQYLPKLQNTVIRPAKDLEFLQMWASRTQGKFASSDDIRKVTGEIHPDMITLLSPRIRNDILTHELQHGVQKNYGGKFPDIKGKDVASGTEDALQAYLNDWGEQEAFAADAAVRQFQKEGMVDLPKFASHPVINIKGTNKTDPSLDSLQKLLLEALEAGSKEFPFAR